MSVLLLNEQPEPAAIKPIRTGSVEHALQLAVQLALQLAVQLAVRMAVQMAVQLAGQLAGRLAGELVGQLAGRLAGQLAVQPEDLAHPGKKQECCRKMMTDCKFDDFQNAFFSGAKV